MLLWFPLCQVTPQSSQVHHLKSTIKKKNKKKNTDSNLPIFLDHKALSLGTNTHSFVSSFLLEIICSLFCCWVITVSWTVKNDCTEPWGSVVQIIYSIDSLCLLTDVKRGPESGPTTIGRSPQRRHWKSLLSHKAGETDRKSLENSFTKG